MRVYINKCIQVRFSNSGLIFKREKAVGGGGVCLVGWGWSNYALI